MALRLNSLVVGLALVAWTLPAFADDFADEADLHFKNGAAAYQRGDYSLALERFLVSNRLVPNRNVIYNIARCFEQLGKFAEAFRYYDLARQDETDPQTIASIETELQRIGKKVSILRISSDPPGATIYIERRDLGPRGVTPRRLALMQGRYRVIAELPGYHPVTVDTSDLAIGESQDLNLLLEPILGRIEIGGQPGTEAVADDANSRVRCRTPCALDLPLGAHQLYLSRPGHLPQQLSVEVKPAKSARIAPRLEQMTGGVVVSTDEPNALVEVDDMPRGFTPTIVTLPVGAHRLRVSLEGFRAIERTVEILPEKQTKAAFELIQTEQVQGASRRVESVEDTPSSVSIVPQAELTALAYPTLAESLRGLPGVYFWDDRGYIGIGMRGLGRLNSYGNRVLVLVDGVPTNDNWLGSSYVGYDAMTDMADVERVELIRGPGSAVYGTGAFSGVINVITRRETRTGAEAGVSTNFDGVARARVRGNVRFGPNSGMYASAAIGRSSGRDFYLPNVADSTSVAATSDAQSGWARGLDGMSSATLRGRAHHGIWSLQWHWNRHDKQLPNAPFDTTFGDPRTKQVDERGFVELRAEPRISAQTTTVSSVALNRYQFRGNYARAWSSGDLEVDTFRGHWITLGERLVHEFGSAITMTLGGEASWHLDVKQTAGDATGTYLDASNPYRILAGYAIVDARLGSRARFSLGGRIDNYTTFGTSANPRVGVVVSPYERGNTKLTFGRAFRAPSAYELYYNDNGRTQVASPHLQPETLLSAEVEHSHRFTPTVIGSVALYANTIRGLIDTVSAGAGYDNVVRFGGTPNPIVAIGTEIGLRREWRSGWMASAYYGYTQARFLSDSRLSTLIAFERDRNIRNVANSPRHSATLKGVAPFLVRGLNLGTRITLEDGRWDRYEQLGEPRQRKTQAAVFWDLVLSAEDPRTHIRGAFGVYNLFDWRYQYPLGTEYGAQRTMSSNGRTVLASLETRF